MSTPPQLKPNPMVIISKCLVCGLNMQFIMPTPRIFNEIDVSVLAISHPPSRCPSCQAVHLPLIRGINAEGIFELEWKPAKARRSPLVVGSDSELKNAIETANLSEKLKTN